MSTVTSQERFKTEKGVFDDFTERNIFELTSKGFLDQMIGPLKIGKESNVFLGQTQGNKIIVKIYRVQNAEFKRMLDYIKVDPRYDYLKSRRREIIFAWTQREYKNIIRAKKSGANVPAPIAYRNNIIVEEMIGKDEPAPPLKDAFPQNPKKFFKEIIANIQKMYNAELVHGDLSAFNILNYKEKPYFIDFSQGTLIKNPNATELLKRDIRNIVQFFGNKVDAEEIFQQIVSNKKCL